MKEKDARFHKYRCPNCNTPLNESMGNYYCPSMLCVLTMNFKRKN